MEVKHTESSTGGDHVTVGVEIPNNEDFIPINFAYAIVKIGINYDI